MKAPVIVDESIKETRIAFYGVCRKQGWPDQLVGRIRKAGTITHLLEYPATLQGTEIIFEWDSLLYSLAPGRYLVDLFEGDTKVGFFQVQLKPHSWGTEVVNHE